MTKIEESLQGYKTILQSQLQDTHPMLLGQFDCILRLLDSAPEIVSQGFGSDVASQRGTSEQSINRSPNQIPNAGVVSNNAIASNQTITDRSFKLKEPTTAGNLSIFCQVNSENVTDRSLELRRNRLETESKKPTIQGVDRTIGANESYTYSFFETSFTRRLKRFSLEHAFRIFSDPNSNPHEVFRLFRLVPCFRERTKMYPYFKDLVTSERAHSLEISSLPFYTIGGAGTHYPDTNEAGDPIYPTKMRVPRRILGILPTGEEPDVTSDVSQPQQNIRELCGFGGDWFDCGDVEGWLKSKGVNIHESTVFPTTNISQTGKLVPMSIKG
jgi:hypothetical protein